MAKTRTNHSGGSRRAAGAAGAAVAAGRGGHGHLHAVLQRRGVRHDAARLGRLGRCDGRIGRGGGAGEGAHGVSRAQATLTLKPPAYFAGSLPSQITPSTSFDVRIASFGTLTLAAAAACL